VLELELELEEDLLLDLSFFLFLLLFLSSTLELELEEDIFLDLDLSFLRFFSFFSFTLLRSGDESLELVESLSRSFETFLEFLFSNDERLEAIFVLNFFKS
jgi:hypothetical protein